MLRVFLPPNLAVAAARDAIAVKVEFDSGAPPAALLPTLALLQSWTGDRAISPLFLQLTRARMGELAAALAGQPVFFWINRPLDAIPWTDGDLPGVGEFLVERKPAPPAASPAATTGSYHPKTKNQAAGTPPLFDGSEHFLAITPPSRDHPAHDAVLALVKSHGFVLEPSNRKWWLRDRHKTLNFLAAHWERLRTDFDARFTPNFERNTARMRPAGVACAATETNDGYDVTLALKAGRATSEAVAAALAGSRGYVEDADGIVLLPSATIERFTRVQRALAGDPAADALSRRSARVSTARVAEVDQLLESLSAGFQPPATWRARSEALRNLFRLAPAPLPAEFEALLRPYQRLGVAWLWHLHRHELGGILADEMGLGKTLQALALLTALHAAKPRPAGVSLVVAPASLLENWRRETARFAPWLRTFVHHGDSRISATGMPGIDLFITSYSTLVRDQDLFSATTFACVIADEAQHIKNRRTLHARALRGLHARGRLLLTGTPMENSLDDLRALFEFLMPGFLPPVPSGIRGDERAWHDERLRARTAPYILRRTKAVVAPELPPKIEQIIWCELAPAQAVLYREWQQRGERELDRLAGGGASEAALRLAALTQLLRLRQICCDPRLVEVARVGPNAPTNTENADAEAGRIKDDPPRPESAKLEAFRELLDEAMDDGHRVLVFSQFTSLLALLRAELEALGLPHCRLDGSMSARARQAEVDRFQNSTDVPVFFISLKAGGTGLNLTGADVVVHFDPWWNPAVEAQATDRAHRLGQMRIVTGYKLICAGTVEEKVLQMQEAKHALLAGVFEASDAAAAKFSLDDLRGLLR